MKEKKVFDTVQAGRLRFRRINAQTRDWRDLYHWFLALAWPQFAAVVLGLYLTINLFFACLYLAESACISGLPPGSFFNAFFFSVETLATVGYGHMYPASLYGHLVATTEIMSGMAGVAVITGLIFVRFSRPSARLEYSRVMVVSPFDGQPSLMFRVANLHHHAMVEAEFAIMLVRHERIREEEATRRFYMLPLQFHRLVLFPAAVTIRHIIDEKSPLYGISAEDLARSDSRFLVSVVCVDTVIPAPVHSQQVYSWRDVRFGERFVEIYNDVDTDIFEVDYGRISDTEPALPGDAS